MCIHDLKQIQFCLEDQSFSHAITLGTVCFSNNTCFPHVNHICAKKPFLNGFDISSVLYFMDIIDATSAKMPLPAFSHHSQNHRNSTGVI